jgi:hypothetical protein
MSIYLYPDYLKFVKNERKTLRFLADQPIINKMFSTLARSASDHYYMVGNNDKILRSTQFEFGCHFDLQIERDSRRIAIEAKVSPQFNLVTYALSVCRENTSPFNLIRKFHFDYALPNPNEDSKPVYHLQYGGEQSPMLKELDVDVEDLQPWLSTPRIYFYPINLALLLDMIFYEFKTEDTWHLVNRPEWRQFIKENENEILKPFFEHIMSFINSGHTGEFLLRDFYYGKQK